MANDHVSHGSKRAKTSINDDFSDDTATREAFKPYVRRPRIPFHIEDMGLDPEAIRSFKDWDKRREQLKKIHADIIKEEDIFVEERNEWVAYHRDLYPNKNEFFVERCSWETKFNEDHLQPLYKRDVMLLKESQTFGILQ